MPSGLPIYMNAEFQQICWNTSVMLSWKLAREITPCENVSEGLRGKGPEHWSQQHRIDEWKRQQGGAVWLEQGK